MPVDIKRRHTGAVLFKSDGADTLKAAVAEAVKAKADLGDADLGGAYLGDADLGGADLRGAYLGGAYLGDADLGDADLRGADLRGADLRGAYLGGAYLGGAYLGDADLGGADLGGAYLGGAYLGGAYLGGAYLGGAYLGGAYLGGAKGVDEKELAARIAESRPAIPKIANIHQTLLAAVTAEGCKLDMGQWHACETTHCRAGWVVTLAGEAGRALEKRFGPANAARMIYRESDPDFRTANFFAGDEEAMADIVASAEREKAKV